MITLATLRRTVSAALEEDAPWGDITSTALLPADARATADLIAREPGVFSGGDVFAAAFTLTDADVQVDLHVGDGDRFDTGDVLASVTGPARSLLTAERVALNFTQRMSGIATLTATYVAAVEGTGARIADTRKTTPGLREFERHAVVSGGGSNHRRSLSDAVMAKDNHLAVLRQGGHDLATALREALGRLPHTTHVVVEVDSLEQIPAVLDGGADTVLLDNFSLDDLRQGWRSSAIVRPPRHPAG
ncbi:nicotinate-nucleotide diphosphorylase (carboxylating) [Microbacterium suwonense]|uniref:nicotinate-nucleotide diphosphorylase (carboxylating) n=1 Tax=Microbacterium suwonense TaxID=683047 RepID=A0ABN6X551_9MICO|nr:nicotinate-nucleotide diphosphorylase (carboxylating) [Microbacterium suwonense]